jgi:signal recognition particle receptor subunit beta
MVLFNYSTKELTAKVVYYGPGLCGKTTNLQWIHEKLPIKNKGKMLSLATETDRTLFFDFLPIELGQVRGMKMRIQLYTVPGQVFYNATRRMVLKGADAVIFVADSQESLLDANVESWENMRQNLEANEINPDEIPTVIQFNKRDLPNALPIEILNERLNPNGLPSHEAVAIKGQGVEETLKTITSLVFRSLASKYGNAENQASAVAVPALATTGPTPSTAPAYGGPGPTTLPPKPSVPPVPRPAAPAAATHDDLLDSLELTPTAESEDDIIEIDVDAAVAPSRAMAPRPGAPLQLDPRATVASTPAESDLIREKIRRLVPKTPVEPMAEPMDEEFDDISLDEVLEAEPLPPVIQARAPAALRPPPPVASPTQALPRLPNVNALQRAPGPPTPRPVAPAGAPAPVAVGSPTIKSTGDPNDFEITIPLSVTTNPQTGQVVLHLHLKLDLRPPR